LVVYGRLEDIIVEGPISFLIVSIAFIELVLNMATAVATLDGGLWKVREIQAFCFFWDQDLTFDLLFKARVDSQQVRVIFRN